MSEEGENRGMDLATFLLARIAEDEEVARAAAPSPWEYQDVESVGGGRVCDPTVEIANLHYEQAGEVDPRIRRTVLSEEADGTGWHIARWDPARVLAECAAKRRIVEQLWDYVANPNPASSDPSGTQALWIVKTLALPYADHGDFRDEWRP